MQKPRWLTDEYATSFFQSFCTMATRAPYRMPMTERPSMYGREYRVANGSIGSEKRTKPDVPIFSRTPARITQPAVGASTCAAGSQGRNGHIGPLMAKPVKNAQHAGLQRQHEDVVLLHALGDGGPGRQDRNEPQERRQQEQQERDAVDADVVVHADRRDPVAPELELEAAALDVVQEEERRRQQEVRQGDPGGRPHDQAPVLLVDQEKGQGPEERQEGDDVQGVAHIPVRHLSVPRVQ